MNWAKTQSRARFNLATSGVGGFPLSGIPMPALEINGPTGYGYAPLSAAIARRYEVDADCVVTAAGTSFANYLAMAAILDPGDEVLLEHPTYELIHSSLSYVGANVKRFYRREEDDYAIKPAEIEKAITPKTKLIVLTNLHNPSSVLTSDETLRAVGDLARSLGARVLVDEVYLDAVYENTPRSSFHLGSEFVVTNSLTKVYGLSGIRCGWILAEPDLARAMWRLNDLFASNNAHPAELLGVAAFEHLDRIRDRARAVVEADRAILRDFLARQDRFGAPRTDWGTTCFLRSKQGGVESFLQRLRADYETSAVPGRFFEMSGHFRIGMGVDTAMFREGVKRMERAALSQPDRPHGVDGRVGN
jgi:aspartate/methionine/tyrosine aminotransferase